MTLRDIERVLYFEAYVVTDPGMTPLKKFSIMTEDDYDAKRKEYGDEFVAKMGAEGIKELQGIDLDIEIAPARRPDRLRSQGQEERQAPEGAGGLQEVRHQARVDGAWKCCRCCRPTCVRWCRWTAAASPPPT
jgi:DNA-directed RNA polymerase beta' subunit